MQSQIPLIAALQQFASLETFMRALSWLGREEFFLLLIPLTYLCMDRKIGLRLAALVLVGDALNVLLKTVFHLPRPYWIDTRVQALATESSYGFPSSHAQNATSVWFFLALCVQKPWAWVVAAILVFGISLSRVFLGVHFVSDVVGGWLIGALFLWLFCRWMPKIEGWLTAKTLWTQITVSALISSLVLLSGLAAQMIAAQALASDPLSQAWAHLADEAHRMDTITSRSGAIFGLGLGWAMSTRWARFDASGTIGKRVLRFVIGVLGLLLCWRGLQLVLPREPEILELVFRFLRYALMSWWVAFLAPYLFLKTNLAAPPRKVAT